MTRGIKLAAALVALLVAVTGLELSAGGLFTGRHEGDTLHLLDIVLREARGQWPHLDFFTPIGLFATAPIAGFIKLGLGAGQAFIAGQALVAALALPMIWHVARTRLAGGWAYLFGGFLIVLILALVHGETIRGVSVSMHYNRWAWALAYLVALPAIVPARGGAGRSGQGADGVAIGAGMAVLALIKVTYLVALLPAVLVGLVARRAWGTLGIGMLAALGVVAAVTLWAGPGFWPAYLGDLLRVAHTPLRPAPGLPFGEMIATPAYLGGTVLLVLAVVFVRQAGRGASGLALLLLAPGLLYIQYQNWGNDPQWLFLLGLILIALRPGEARAGLLGWDLGKAMSITATAAFALGAPVAINLAWSPLRHMAAKPTGYLPVVPGSGVHEDLQTAIVRARRINVVQPMDGPGMPLEGAIAGTARGPVTHWHGEDWPDCEISLGYPAWFEAMAGDLVASGLVEGKAIFTADILQAPWIYGAGEPLKGGAPWFYDGFAGISNADFLLVPTCAVRTKVRAMVLAAVEEADLPLIEVRRNAMYGLFALQTP